MVNVDVPLEVVFDQRLFIKSSAVAASPFSNVQAAAPADGVKVAMSLPASSVVVAPVPAIFSQFHLKVINVLFSFGN